MVEKKESASSSALLDGKYELGRLLGHGTFARVYHARNLRTGKAVAMKVVGKEKVIRVGMEEQVKREISVMKMVKHPNIVELHEVMASKSKIYFAMELVRGGELFSKVSKGRLREDSARAYFRQLISAVDFCHSRGVYHRDLKPENLLLDEEGNLKVTDFGLSALSDHLRQDGLLHTTCGTPAYVAPEVIGKRGYDGPKADIWSCGVVLFVLLAGFLPFRDDNLAAMYRKVSKADFDFPAWFSAESRRLIAKLLVADPEKRISVQGIMRIPWFSKGFSRSASFNSLDSAAGEDSVPCGGDEEGKSPSPKFYNAFELIAAMSAGFDLSSMFESKRRPGSVFTSRCSAAAIMARIEAVAERLRFKIVRVRDFRVRLQGGSEGRKGRLSVTAEVFQPAPEIAVVEFSKSSGDTLEYVRFFEDDVRPALKDVVWTWQGDSVENMIRGP